LGKKKGYGILASVSFFVLPRIARAPLPYSDSVSLIRIFFAILAFFDLSHVGLTLSDLGYDGAFDPARWNQLVFGNVVITLVLFAWRVAWFVTTSDTSRVKKAD
jgi:hypothetical protein